MHQDIAAQFVAADKKYRKRIFVFFVEHRNLVVQRQRVAVSSESINVEVNNKLELTEFSFSEIEQNSLQSAKVVITNGDALALDNEIVSA